jgi:hypothetical protein
MDSRKQALHEQFTTTANALAQLYKRAVQDEREAFASGASHVLQHLSMITEGGSRGLSAVEVRAFLSDMMRQSLEQQPSLDSQQQTLQPQQQQQQQNQSLPTPQQAEHPLIENPLQTEQRTDLQTPNVQYMIPPMFPLKRRADYPDMNALFSDAFSVTSSPGKRSRYDNAHYYQSSSLPLGSYSGPSQ